MDWKCFCSLGAPTCRCPTGFTGPNCNQNTCKDYCQNGGSCTVSLGNQPMCQCRDSFVGDQCQYSECSEPVHKNRPAFIG